MQKSIGFLSILTLLIMAAGCHSSKSTVGSAGKPGGSEMLHQYQWNLEELNGQPVTAQPTGKIPHLLFSPGQPNNVAGNAGCNTIRGSVEISGAGSIKFSPLATTRMFCPSENIEAKFLEALGKVNNWSIVNDQLFLSSEKTLLAKFRGVTPMTGTQASLNGTWELNYISGKRIAFEGLYPGKKPQLVFTDSRAEASGHTSCNSFRSNVNISNNQINFLEPMAMTKMACEGEGESSFLEMLKKVNKYAVDSATLTLLTDDVAVMRFSRKQ